jgi:CBS domain-containing protein
MQKIADVMTRDVAVLGPQESVQRAAQLMDELNVGAVPVCNGKKLVGLITDRDIVVRSTAAGTAPAQCRIADVMSEHVRWCFDDQSVDEVLEQMSDTQIRRVPVVNRQKHLVGIVSLGDLATRCDGDEAGSALRDISSPSQPDRPSGTITH